jgi:hypothetical protein
MADETINIPALRSAINAEQSDFLEKYSSRIDQVENFRPKAVILTAVGACLAGLSRVDPGSVGLVLLAVGSTMALLGAVAVGFMDRKKLEIGQNAKNALKTADAALNLAETYQREHEQLHEAANALDTKRRSRLSAIEEMTTMFEAGLLSKSDDCQVAEELLRHAIGSIRNAIDYRGDDVMSVSIYRRQGSGKHERLASIATQWTHPTKAFDSKKFCARNDGFSGHAWSNAEAHPDHFGDVIISDASLPHIRQKYPVNGSPAELEALYNSVAAIPILVKSKNEIWGMVYATSSRTCVFTPDESASARIQNVGMIKDIARICSLLEGLSRAPDFEVPNGA